MTYQYFLSSPEMLSRKTLLLTPVTHLRKINQPKYNYYDNQQ